MNRQLPSEALDFAAVTRESLAKLGGVDLARRCERAPHLRRTELEPALRSLGLLDLSPLDGTVETVAAALAVREAGAVVCPWPLVAQIGCDVDGADAVFDVTGSPTRLAHLDVLQAPVARDRRAQVLTVEHSGAVVTKPVDPFGVPCRLAPAGAMGSHARWLASILTSFWILGAMTTVVDIAVSYSRERRQFGRVIGEFGAIRWRLADMAVARTGLEELAYFTLWRHLSGQLDSADVLALRLYALDSADEILTHGHQVLAAIGLCDEHDLSIIDRHLQPDLRRAGARQETGAFLAEALAEDGFQALFELSPRASSPAAVPAVTTAPSDGRWSERHAGERG